MNVNVSGSSHVTTGEYEKISISGSAKLDGLIRCQSLHVSGACAGGAELEAAEDVRVSGSCKLDKITCGGSCKASGALRLTRGIEAEHDLSVSGGLKCAEDIKCGEFRLSGAAKVGGGIEAEAVNVSGSLDCDGLVNAETVDIRYGKSMQIGAIGGGTIRIRRSKNASLGKRLALFAGMTADFVTVRDSIEGDDIALEGVKTPVVRGRVVAIGPDCKIDLVQYSEKIEIDPSATVEKYEQV